MRGKLLALAAALGLLVATTGTAGAITWGQPDGDSHPHVVQILFVQDGVGYYGCSGTLLSPYVVLTAGHCTGFLDSSGDLNSNEITYVRNAPDINETIVDELLAIYGGNVSAWLANEWISGQATPHPDYADFAGFPNTFDIGLVLLDSPINVNTYGVLPSQGQFDYLMTAKGSPSHRMVEVVGYGLVGKIPAFADNNIWDRRVGYSTIINTSKSAVVGPQNFMYTNNPGVGTGVGGTCSGDSGGPAFWIDPATGQPTNLIVGVNSYGIAPLCNGNDYQFRTDSKAAATFVSSYLGWTP